MLMDCQTDFRKESSVTIQCGSESPSPSPSPTNASTDVVPVKGDGSNLEPKPNSNNNNNGEPLLRTGRWTPDEKILFLYGLRMFGKGRWKKISVYLPQRSLVQIKSHAQKVLKRQEAGENIFRRLEEKHNEIDNLVVQAARQRDALRMAGINVNTSLMKPRKNLVKRSTKKKNIHAQITNTVSLSSAVQGSLFHKSINTSTDAINHTSDSSVLAAAALCQLSSIGGAWEQRENSTTINGKGQEAIV